jgi:molybdopterin molybdotransferase
LASAEECLEVMTGAQLPARCDAVVPVERITVRDGVATLAPEVEVVPWQNVHRRASDSEAGATVLEAGVVLGPAEVAVIASAGCAEAEVSELPRIMVISTGNELIEPGQPIRPWQIRRSNSYGILASLTRHGFTRLANDHVPDDLDALRERLRAHLNSHDVLILSGGVSAGRFDYIPQVLSELGVTQVFHKIAQRPGKPMWFGVRADGKAVYALPGNPVSTLVCLRRYVIPGLYAAMDATPSALETIPLSAAAKTSAELCVFLPVQSSCDDAGRRWANPRPTQGSADFVSLLGTQGFVELPPTQGMMERGTVVTFYPW